MAVGFVSVALRLLYFKWLDEAHERECASVLRRVGDREVKENEWQRALALPLHSLALDDTSCRFLTRVCNNSHDVEAVELSLLPVELAIDANTFETRSCT